MSDKSFNESKVKSIESTVSDTNTVANDKEFMLSTIDNKFNPFDRFNDWYRFDMDHGYNTCGYLARVARVSDALSDADYDEEVNRAIDSIIRTDPLDQYIKVFKNNKK